MDRFRGLPVREEEYTVAMVGFQLFVMTNFGLDVSYILLDPSRHCYMLRQILLTLPDL